MILSDISFTPVFGSIDHICFVKRSSTI